MRSIVKNDDGTYTTTILSMDGCKYLYEDVCCNDKSEFVADFPDQKKDCVECKFFEKEDGVV